MSYPCCAEGLCPQHLQQMQVDKSWRRRDAQMRTQWGHGVRFDYDGDSDSGLTGPGRSAPADYDDPTADVAVARAMGFEAWKDDIIEDYLSALRRRNGETEEGQAA